VYLFVNERELNLISHNVILIFILLQWQILAV